MSYPIVGAFFRPPAKAILQVLPAEAKLQLVPEPDNPYDPNAIKVIVASAEIPTSQFELLEELAAPFGFTAQDIFEANEWHLGYVPRDIAATLELTEQKQGHLTFNLKGDPAVEFDK